MKKIFILLTTLIFISSCSNQKSLEKIKELENKVSSLEKESEKMKLSLSEDENVLIDIIKWEWFTPHFAERKIIFNIDKTYEFSLDLENIEQWKYSLSGSKIILNNWKEELILNLNWWNWEDKNFYLKNDKKWEYFVKN